jgi:hypothetical protein
VPGRDPARWCRSVVRLSGSERGARRNQVTSTVLLTPPTSCSGSDPVTKPIQSTSLIVHPTLDVKGWIARPPSPEAARPGRCPRCGAASRPTGSGLGLHGHGLRDRAVFGPPDADADPDRAWVRCRRYRCVGGTCGAVILVVPRGVSPRRHYSLVAIAMAMTLWGILALPPARVRGRICVSPSVAWGTEWSALRRWSHAARALVDLPASMVFTLREVAARVAQIAIGRAPPSLRTAPFVAQACAGATARP